MLYVKPATNGIVGITRDFHNCACHLRDYNKKVQEGNHTTSMADHEYQGGGGMAGLNGGGVGAVPGGLVVAGAGGPDGSGGGAAGVAERGGGPGAAGGADGGGRGGFVPGVDHRQSLTWSRVNPSGCLPPPEVGGGFCRGEGTAVHVRGEFEA